MPDSSEPRFDPEAVRAGEIKESKRIIAAIQGELGSSGEPIPDDEWDIGFVAGLNCALSHARVLGDDHA